MQNDLDAGQSRLVLQWCDIVMSGMPLPSQARDILGWAHWAHDHDLHDMAVALAVDVLELAPLPGGGKGWLQP